VAEDMKTAVLMLREAYDAFNRGDFDAILERLHPDVEWNRYAEVEGPIQGREAVRAFLQPDLFERQHGEILETAVHGDRILVHVNFTAVGRGSGIELEQDGWQLWTIRDGLAAKLEVFLDRGEALAAAGQES